MRLIVIIAFVIMVDSVDTIPVQKIQHIQVDSLSIKLDSLIKILEQKQQNEIQHRTDLE